MSRRPRHPAFPATTLAIGYAALAEFTIWISGTTLTGPAFFPAAGLTVVALWRSPVRRWPWLLASVAVAEAVVDLRHGLGWATIGFVLANTIEPLVSAAILRRRLDPELTSAWAVAKFVAIAGVVGPAVGAAIGGATWWLSGVDGVFMPWWVADGLGVAVLGLAALAWSSPRPLQRRTESTVYLAVAAAVAGLMFFSQVELGVLLLPLAVWAGLRLGVRIAATATAVLAFVAQIATALGTGPFWHENSDPQHAILLLQVYVATSVLVATSLAIEISRGRYLMARLAASEHETRRHADRISALLEVSPTAMVELGGDGRVLRWNPEAERLYGSFVVGEPWSAPIDIAGAPTGGEVTGPVDLGQGPRWIQAAWRPLDNGGVLVTGVDVTHRKLAETALQREVDSINRFVAAVSHELRTPLNNAFGYLEVAMEDGQLTEREKTDMVAIGLDQTRDAVRIVDDLLAASSGRHGAIHVRPTAVDVAEVMRSSMAEIQGRGTVDLTPGLVAWADPVRLRQIIRNLLSNRTRYGGPGHRVSTRTEGEMVLIEVADDGPPIPEDRREAIFLPFESGHDDRPSDSAGLGLSVARDLARAMGGDLVYDHAGGYSILTVSLPLHAAATVGPPADILSGGGDSVTQDNVEEYDDELVGLLELVWGDGFLAPGGPESVARTVAGVDLTGREVLDVGCGVGGADLVLSSRFGARVTGLDVEPDLIERARRNAAGEDIHYVCAPPGPLPFPNGSFDHVFTHAAIIHVPDKRAMFSEIMRVLRPGGWLLAYDWLKGSEPFSADMLYWFELEGLTYVMDDLDGYLATLTDVGFVDVTGEDDNLGYRAIAHQEYERMRGEWHQRITDLLGPDRRDHFIEDWRMLTVVLDNGELRPGYFRGRKPPA